MRQTIQRHAPGTHVRRRCMSIHGKEKENTQTPCADSYLRPFLHTTAFPATDTQSTYTMRIILSNNRLHIHTPPTASLWHSGKAVTPHPHTPPPFHRFIFLIFRPTEIQPPHRIFTSRTPHSASTTITRMPTHHEDTPRRTAQYGIPQYELPAAIDRPIAIAYLCIAFRENPMRRTLFHAKNSHTEAEPAPYII